MSEHYKALFRLFHKLPHVEVWNTMWLHDSAYMHVKLVDYYRICFV